MKKIYFKSLKTRLTFWFLILALLPLIIVSFFSYNQRAAAIKKREFGKLLAIRDLKVQQLNAWLDYRISDIQTLAESSEIQSCDLLLDHQKSVKDESKIIENARKCLNRYVENHKDYNEIFILNPQTGKIAISTDRDLENEDRSTRPYFTEPMRTGKLLVERIYYSKAKKQPTMTFSIPIRCRRHLSKHIIGVLVARIDVEHSIYNLLLDRTGMGKTGETLIINNDLIILNELRSSEKSPLNLKTNSKAALLASQGKTGILEATDYRGKKILAAYTYIPRTQWGFVVKQDLDELNAPINQMLGDFLVILMILTVAVYFVGLFWSNFIARPILEMAKVSKRIQEGDLHARNVINTEDELGYLAESFNNMTDAIVSQISVERGVSEIIETMVAFSESKKNFRRTLLKKLMAVTNSDLGSHYQYNPGHNIFEHFTSIGINPKLLKPFDASIREGEFGKSLESKKISHIKNIPADTLFTFKTFTGTLLPREIITIPIVNGDTVVGITSLAGLNAYSNESIKILNQVWLFMNTAFSNRRAHEETQKLSRKLQQKNQKLLAQSEELKSKAKELKQQSKGLQRQNIQLELQKKQIEEATRLKSQFLSNMSHELRTPLNSILALSRVLIMQGKPKLSDEEQKFLEIIERNGKNLLALINDILDLSKIESGRIDINPKTFSLRAMIETIVESLEPIAEEKRIQMIQHIQDSCSHIESDEARVYQILQNIIGNAIKFTQEGSVTVSAYSENEQICVEVTDTGIGIPEKELPYIFDEFRQVDGSSSRKFEGTGLGLAIAKRSAQVLEGEITVTSVPAKGSTFILSLPSTWQSRTPLYEPEVPKPKRHTKIKPSRKTVLVVDNNPNVVAMVTKYLLHEGYNTITATSGAEALRLAQLYQPFAITLDIIMPEMDGWEVLQKLKDNPATKDIPVIVITVSEEKETGFALGAVGFITKPVNKKILTSEIQKIGVVKPHQIMIVDDNEIDRSEIAAVLEEEGLHTITAEGGGRCLELLGKHLPDVLVLDLVMPEMDGFELLDRIRSDDKTRDLPVIIVSAKDLNAVERKKLNGRVSSVLGKTLTLSNHLLTEIKKILAEIENHPRRLNAKTLNLPETTPTVLVVEDNPDNMVSITAVLKENYNVLKAFDGEQGLRNAMTQQPDLILLDMSLPKMDGFAFVKKIKGNLETRQIPVIALTAQAMKGDRERIIEAGCDDYISKPFDFEELLNKMNDWLYKS